MIFSFVYSCHRASTLHCYGHPGGTITSEDIKWTFQKVRNDVYHVQSHDGWYLTRVWSGIVELHRSPSDQSEWEVTREGQDREVSFSFKANGRLLTCTSMGVIEGNRKKCKGWELWRITTNHQGGRSGPNGKRILRLYACLPCLWLSVHWPA